MCVRKYVYVSYRYKWGDWFWFIEVCVCVHVYMCVCWKNKTKQLPPQKQKPKQNKTGNLSIVMATFLTNFNLHCQTIFSWQQLKNKSFLFVFFSNGNRGFYFLLIFLNFSLSQKHRDHFYSTEGNIFIWGGGREFLSGKAEFQKVIWNCK